MTHKLEHTTDRPDAVQGDGKVPICAGCQDSPPLFALYSFLSDEQSEGCPTANLEKSLPAKAALVFGLEAAREALASP